MRSLQQMKLHLIKESRALLINAFIPSSWRLLLITDSTLMGIKRIALSVLSIAERKEMKMKLIY